MTNTLYIRDWTRRQAAALAVAESAADRTEQHMEALYSAIAALITSGNDVLRVVDAPEHVERAWRDVVIMARRTRQHVEAER